MRVYWISVDVQLNILTEKMLYYLLSIKYHKHVENYNTRIRKLKFYVFDFKWIRPSPWVVRKRANLIYIFYMQVILFTYLSA